MGGLYGIEGAMGDWSWVEGVVGGWGGVDGVVGSWSGVEGVVGGWSGVEGVVGGWYGIERVVGGWCSRWCSHSGERCGDRGRSGWVVARRSQHIGSAPQSGLAHCVGRLRERARVERLRGSGWLGMCQREGRCST